MGKMQGDAIIMANFQVDPSKLQVSKWGEYYAQAMWLERWRLDNQAKMMQELFGGG